MSEQECPECSVENAEYLGNEDDGSPVYKCKSCGKVFIEDLDEEMEDE